MVTASPEELDIEETELDEDEEPRDLRYEITSFPADYTLKVMYEKWSAGQLIIPDFQRRYVWNLPQASRLIESFLLGLPIPQVFLYRERDSPKLLVVDGHQRLATIAKFYSGQFSENRVFRLRGVDKRWDGQTYNELPEDDRLALDDCTLRSIVIQQTQPNDNSSVYQIFERLNTGGTQLNAMEIRKAIYHEVAYPFVEELSQDENWRALIGMGAEDRRLRDVELALRVSALAADWREYTKPMKRFITDYMDALEGMSQEERNLISDRFAKATAIARSKFEERPFHLRGRLNVAALDSVLGTMMEEEASLAPRLGARYKRLLRNADFVETTQHDTSDSVVVKRRFELVRSALSES